MLKAYTHASLERDSIFNVVYLLGNNSYWHVCYKPTHYELYAVSACDRVVLNCLC